MQEGRGRGGAERQTHAGKLEREIRQMEERKQGARRESKQHFKER